MMNERIRELAEQSGWRYDNGEWQFADDSDVEKFAQLIVAECVGVCEEYHGTAGDQAAQYIGQGIKEHFGVR